MAHDVLDLKISTVKKKSSKIAKLHKDVSDFVCQRMGLGIEGNKLTTVRLQGCTIGCGKGTNVFNRVKFGTLNSYVCNYGANFDTRNKSGQRFAYG